MVNQYKGVKGGNPAMRPVKVLKKHTCINCGASFDKLIDAHKLPKAIMCVKCHNAKSIPVRCSDCRKMNSHTFSVTKQSDPWKVYLNQDYKLYWMCNGCVGSANTNISYDRHDDFADYGDDPYYS